MPRTSMPFARARTPREVDVPGLLTLRNDMPAQIAMLAHPTPNTDDGVRAWVARRTNDPQTLFFTIADEADAIVGFSQIIAIDAISRHGFLGIAIVERRRGCGFGRAGLRATLAAARLDGRLHKVLLYVAADNTVARALYGSEAFREVGVLERHYRGPEGWHDVVLMERMLRATDA